MGSDKSTMHGLLHQIMCWGLALSAGKRKRIIVLKVVHIVYLLSLRVTYLSKITLLSTELGRDVSSY